MNMRRISVWQTLAFFICFFSTLGLAEKAGAQSAFVRVNQAGYEQGNGPFRAYLMSTATVTSGKFKVVDSLGKTAYEGAVGALVGTWGHSAKLTYSVYALDFTVPGHEIYEIKLEGKPAATSPRFAVDCPEELYSGLLLNSLFFYETHRDGDDFVPNALRTAASHEKDENARVFMPPALDSNDYINNVPPMKPLQPAKLPNVDASGGWWDAGDYLKYVETTSYTAALMEIGVRDFPEQMGERARTNPPPPPVAVSYAGNSGPGAPRSSDFTQEAQFGVDWLNKMWNAKTKTLYYQVDNTQDWNYYGEGDISSMTGICGGTYASPYCLITEYDIWTLPQAADEYKQAGDPKPCYAFTTEYICNRPVFVAGPAGAKISPNLAGRLTAAFALCYQLNREENSSLANQCLKNAEEVFALADTSFPDPAPSAGSGNCSNCLLTVIPFDAYPESVWDDDMELGATELYFALTGRGEDLPAGLPVTDPMVYLRDATRYAKNYRTLIHDAGYADTLNLYDVSGLAHYELYRALDEAESTQGLVLTKSEIRDLFLAQVNDAITNSTGDAWGFAFPWNQSDSTSHGAGLSVMASEAYSLTHDKKYEVYAQRWLGNILGANAWGSSFIVGDGSTFPNCIQHQVANLAGALDGTSGGTPVLWGAVSEGPNGYTTSGTLDGMNLCPANGVDTFRKFNGNNGAHDPSVEALYKDDVQSYSTTEPGIDLSASSFLMWSWRMAGHPAF